MPQPSTNRKIAEKHKHIVETGERRRGAFIHVRGRGILERAHNSPFVWDCGQKIQYALMEGFSQCACESSAVATLSSHDTCVLIPMFQ